MTFKLPLARTIILTDAGTMAYSEELAAYDGTPGGDTPTVTLSALGLSGKLAAGKSSSGNIIDTTAGSAVQTNAPGLSIDGASYAYDGSGPAGSYDLVETLAGATNSPRTTVITIAAATVTATVHNTPSSSTLLPAQVEGAHALFTARQEALNGRKEGAATILNTPSNSTLLPAQVDGAHALFLARQETLNARSIAA